MRVSHQNGKCSLEGGDGSSLLLQRHQVAAETVMLLRQSKSRKPVFPQEQVAF